MMPGWMRATINHPPPRDERPYHVRSREELESEAAWVRRAYLDEPAPNSEFGPLCSHEDETWQPLQCVHGVGEYDDCELCEERAAAEAHDEWAADDYRTEPFPADDELVPGGAVSTTVAPGTHQDADGAVTTAPRGPGGAAPSVQAPAVPAYGRTDTAPVVTGHGAADGPRPKVGRGGGHGAADGHGDGWAGAAGLDLILWAAVATALVITAVYAAVEVAHWPNVIGGG